MKTFKQFIGFCLVGGSNVVINWTIYYLFIFLIASSTNITGDLKEITLPFENIHHINFTGYVSSLNVQIGTFLGFVVSMFSGFLLNYFFVFKETQETFWKSLLRFAIVYICTSYILTAVLTQIITDINLFGVGVMIAPLICTVINTPVNFFFSKKWAFKK